MARDLVHATAVAVALDPDGPLRGALLVGPSGCGKSSLALALIETCPWRRTSLVSDDATLVETHDARLFARAPTNTAGLIEIRGFGPAPIRLAPRVALIAAFDFDRAGERLPEPDFRLFGAGRLPVWPFKAGEDGPNRLRVILRAILVKQACPPPLGKALQGL